MIQILKQIKQVVTRKLQAVTHRQQQITTMGKQTQQQIQQPITALQMGQTYQSTQLMPLRIQLCLKMFVAWGLVALYLLLVLGCLAVNMFVTLTVNE